MYIWKYEWTLHYYDNYKDENIFDNVRFLIISKEYCFIKRLVENNKIDFDNRELKDKFMEEFERYPTFNNNTYNRDFNINWLLMLIAISDTPIEDLVSYLRDEEEKNK